MHLGESTGDAGIDLITCLTDTLFPQTADYRDHVHRIKREAVGETVTHVCAELGLRRLVGAAGVHGPRSLVVLLVQ